MIVMCFFKIQFFVPGLTLIEHFGFGTGNTEASLYRKQFVDPLQEDLEAFYSSNSLHAPGECNFCLR